MPDPEDLQTMDCESAASSLFLEHNRVLVGYLTLRLQSRQEAKEIAQEAFLRVLQLKRIGTPDSLRAYLFKVANNLAIDRLRHRSVRRRVEDQVESIETLASDSSEFDDPAHKALAQERTEQLLGFLRELPAKCRQAFSMHRLEGLPQREVASRLGISERMVRRYVSYTMVHCRLRSDGLQPDQVRQKVSL